MCKRMLMRRRFPLRPGPTASCVHDYRALFPLQGSAQKPSTTAAAPGCLYASRAWHSRSLQRHAAVSQRSTAQHRMHQPLLRPVVGAARAEPDAADQPAQAFGRVRKQTVLNALVAVVLVALVGRSVLESLAPDWSSRHIAPVLLQHRWTHPTGTWRPVTLTA
jgi:hypothetical protein